MRAGEIFLDLGRQRDWGSGVQTRKGETYEKSRSRRGGAAEGRGYFKDPAFTGLAATSKTIKENPQRVRRMVRTIVRAVIHTCDNTEDALLVSMKRLGLDRDAAQDAYDPRSFSSYWPTEKGWICGSSTK